MMNTDINEFLLYKEFTEMNGNVPTLQFNALILTILKKWSKIIKGIENSDNVTSPFNPYLELFDLDRPAKAMYNKLICNDTLINERLTLLNKHLDVQITLEEYLEALKAINKITIVSKYRSFQYRLLTKSHTSYESNGNR